MTNILVLGDSHAGCFRKAKNDYRYTVIDVGGATAYGSIKFSSVTNALSIFEDNLKRHPQNNYVCTQLGEVDCGFVMWVRSKRKGISIEKQLVSSLNNYKNFLTNTVNKYYAPKNTIVLSAPLPTILDNTDKRFLKGARSEVNATLEQRTELTIGYNQRLSVICKEEGYGWIDVTTDTMDKTTGLVDEKWKNSNPYDHHLNPDLIWQIYEDKIRKLIKK